MSDQYTYVQYGDCKSQLAERLGDPTKTFFGDEELGLYIQEALRAFNAGCQFHRDRAVSGTTQSLSFYDVANELNLVLERNYSSDTAQSLIKYHLMESQTSGTWSDQFSQEGLTTALIQRQNQFQFDTGMVLTSVPSVNAPSTPIGRIPLSQDYIDIRRAVWTDTNGTRKYLWRTNEYSLSALRPQNFLTPDFPEEYSVSVARNTEMMLYPPPNSAGTLDLIVVKNGPALDPNVGTLMHVVSDFGDGIKWGAMADMLNQSGPGNDSQRAKYCEARYQDYATIGRVWATILQGYINEQPIMLQAVNDLDIFVPSWQQTVGVPTQIGLMNNLYCVAPRANGTYGLSFDVIRNAILPSADNDYIQLPREMMECFLGYAAHIALFKVEGPEFEASMPLYENFIRMCTEYNSKLKAEDFDLMPERQAAIEDEKKVPRRK